jgi:hypothetical protein
MTQLVQLNTVVHAYRPISIYVKMHPHKCFIRVYRDLPISYHIETSGAQTPRSISLGRPNIVPWRLILVGPQCGTSYMSPFWRQVS